MSMMFGNSVCSFIRPVIGINTARLVMCCFRAKCLWHTGILSACFEKACLGSTKCERLH